jgi:hypothetical protein
MTYSNLLEKLPPELVEFWQDRLDTTTVDLLDPATDQKQLGLLVLNVVKDTSEQADLLGLASAEVLKTLERLGIELLKLIG